MPRSRPSISLPPPERLAAVRLHPICDAGTLPHVRGRDPQCPHRPVVYGAADPKAGSLGSVTDLFALPYNHHPVVESGLLEQECAQVLSAFFQNLRKQKSR